MKLHEAKYLADELVRQMRPRCRRIEIAGIIRREKREVSDIEIVCIPKWDKRVFVTGLFGDTESHDINLLHEWALDSNIRWIWKNKGVSIETKPKANGKMWKGVLPGGAQLDLFITTPSRWGMTYLIRTGSSDFARAMVTHARNEEGRFVEEGFLHIEGHPVATPEETDVFRLLGLEYVEPHLRRDERDLKAVRS